MYNLFARALETGRKVSLWQISGFVIQYTETVPSLCNSCPSTSFKLCTGIALS
jgi:hypothetical protein